MARSPRLSRQPRPCGTATGKYTVKYQVINISFGSIFEGDLADLLLKQIAITTKVAGTLLLFLRSHAPVCSGRLRDSFRIAGITATSITIACHSYGEHTRKYSHRWGTVDYFKQAQTFAQAAAQREIDGITFISEGDTGKNLRDLLGNIF